FLSQPIFGIIETLRKLDPLVRPETLVTDAGSTMRAIVEEAQRSLKRCAFVGGHPMAGKELRGAAAADGDLFRGRPWVLTSDVDHELRKWIAAFGAREIILDPVQHDGMVAGPGLLDSTRLAMSSFELWRDILETNASEVSAALDAYISKLQALRS